jgi:2-polyprenyl-3-methyl-5-hydroxy-6-metoxy-1,4-benzoquinol methylase
MTTPGVEALPQYTLKEGPYSSHSLLLGQFPADGRGRRVLDVGCASGYLSGILASRGFQVTAMDC